MRRAEQREGAVGAEGAEKKVAILIHSMVPLAIENMVVVADVVFKCLNSLVVAAQSVQVGKPAFDLAIPFCYRCTRLIRIL